MSDQHETDYNPNSLNAVLARIEQRQIDHGRKLDGLADKQTEDTENLHKRVNELSRKHYYAAGLGAGIAMVIREFFSKH